MTQQMEDDMAMTTTPFDAARAEAFGGEIFGLYKGAMVTYMIDIGHRTGLFTAAAEGPATSKGLAVRAGLDERYVREWLGAMTTAHIFEYDPTSGVYELPLEHAACLTGDGSSNAARLSQFATHLGRFVQPVAGVFRDGGGIPYSEYVPEFTDVMDASSCNVFDEHLLDDLVPLIPGLPGRIATGACVADVGCGTGHAIVVMARAYPASTFIGYDTSEPAIARARAEATDAELTNATFELCDVAGLTVDEPFDAIMSFDTIHDQADPDAVLSAVHSALVPGGSYLMVEPRVSTTSRTTSTTRWPRCCTRSARSTASRCHWRKAAPDSAPHSVNRRRSTCSPRPGSARSKSLPRPAIPSTACTSPTRKVEVNEFHGSATTHVTASADEVFAFITDLDRLPEWNRAIRRVVERPAALVSAAEWVVVMHPPKVPSWKSRSHLEEIEPGTRFAYRSHTDDRNPSYAHWQWNLERTADGVEVTVSRDGYPKTRFRRRIAAPLRSRMLQREAAASLDTIRRTLEPQPTKAP